MSKNELSRRDFLKAMAAGSVAAAAVNILPLSGTVAAQDMTYSEAPMLADLVASGDLPPVAERIPKNPRVITPYDEIGEYGGTWHRAFKGLSDRWGPNKLQEEMIVEWYAPDPDTLGLEANYVSDWSQNDDATEFSFTLRDGLHWSDGAPFTTDDVQFAYELMTSDPPLLNPPAHLVIDGELMGLEIVDDLTWKISFKGPNPLLPITFARTSAGGVSGGPIMGAPRHYLEKFIGNADTADQDAINAALDANGLDSWEQLWFYQAPGDIQGPIPFWFRNPDMPAINAWRSTNTPLDDPYMMERNPFYHAVDTEGNQLPYIDKIQHNLFDQTETLNLWIAQGQIDMQMRHLSAADYTFYKENEEAGGYKIINWKAAWTHAFHPNVSHPDPAISALLDQSDFREALSISINRQDMNDLIYNGLNEPRQASPVSGSPQFDPDFETRWIEYDPDKANQLLDGLGLTERDANGYRMNADGTPLALTITWSDAGFSGSQDEVNQVLQYWQAIGLNVNQELVERSLYEQRCQEGTVQIGVWSVDRSAVVMADPTRYLGEVSDGPWGINYARWLQANLYGETVVGNQIEPPADHPIRDILDLWQKTKVEPDETQRNAYFKQLLDIHKEHPYQIGTVGEDPVPVVVKNNFFNIDAGFIYDDPLRSQGLIMPAQLFIRNA